MSVVPPPMSTTMLPDGSVMGKPGADRRHHGLFHQVDFAGLGAVGGVLDRALFHLGNLRRHADHDPRMHQHLAVVRLLDEVVQHLLGDFEVGDHAVLHGLDGHDVARRAPQHLLGFLAHGFYFAGVLVDGHDGRLVDHDALPGRVDQRVGGAEVDGQIARKHAEERAQAVRARRARLIAVRRHGEPGFYLTGVLYGQRPKLSGPGLGYRTCRLL